MKTKVLGWCTIISVSIVLILCGIRFKRIICAYMDFYAENTSLSDKYLSCETEPIDKTFSESSGIDEFGQTRVEKDFVIRTFNKSYEKFKEKTFSKYKEFAKHNSSIVETHDKGAYFIHKKLITSYPFEWTVNMIKDAFVAALQLSIDLRQSGLILLDCTPRNFVYNFTKPVYVDFFGILADDFCPNGTDTVNLEYAEKNRHSFIDVKATQTHFFVAFAKAFTLLHQEKYGRAREILMLPLIENVLCAGVKDDIGIIGTIEGSNLPFTDLHKQILERVKSTPINTSSSKNKNYYFDKNEFFEFSDQSKWKTKQRVIYKILKMYNPETVLDIGCNTGWFSILAERNGAKVISIDSDEGVVDNLYLVSKKYNLKILPLKINFEDLDKRYLIKSENIFNERELFSAPVNRLKSDVTLCLALVHHLILSNGMSVEKVMNILARLSNKALVVEIPNLKDKLIVSDPNHFKYAKTIKPEDYSKEAFIKAGEKYFKKYKICPSHPKTRTIIIFEK